MNMDNLKVNMQYFLPKHLLSRGMSFLANAKLGRCTTFAIEQFVKFYKVDMTEAENEIEDFATFNDFFSRSLKAQTRPIDANVDTLVFPADGKICQFGDLRADFMLQAKGHYFTIEALLADESDADVFADGKFITIYLSPSDYHRVHIPVSGKLLKMTYIPGELFSVNPLYVQNIPELFSRNERVVCIFETPCGKMAEIFVGATIVGSISTEWSGIVAPNGSKEINVTTYEKDNPEYDKGAQIGKFLMGSTVICLFEKDKVEFIDSLECAQTTRVGQTMGRIVSISNTSAKNKTLKASKTQKQIRKK